MPVEQALPGQRPVEIPRCVDHHLDDALDVAADRHIAADLDPELARDRGANLFGIECLSLDGRGRYHLCRQGLEARLAPELKAKALHAAEQPALAMAYVGQAGRQLFGIPGKVRPVGLFVDPGHIHLIICGESTTYSPQGQDLHRMICGEEECLSPKSALDAIMPFERKSNGFGYTQFPPRPHLESVVSRPLQRIDFAGPKQHHFPALMMPIRPGYCALSLSRHWKRTSTGTLTLSARRRTSRQASGADCPWIEIPRSG